LLPTLPITHIPATRSGTKYAVGPEHYGQYARQNGVFIGCNNKRRQHFDERRVTRFKTTRTQEKRIKLGYPSPPTPTKDEIIKLDRVRRGANPTCLHLRVKKEVRDFLYPNLFFCAHCDDYVEAMIHSMNKKAIKRDSRAFRFQGGHTNFITPTTLIDHKRLWRLFQQETPEYPETPARKDRTTSMSTMTPAASTQVSLLTITPPVAPTPASDVPLENDPAHDVLRSLQADYQNLLGREAENAGAVQELQSKLSELPCLQQRYNDLLKRHQSLILQMIDAKGLVLRAINLPLMRSKNLMDPALSSPIRTLRSRRKSSL
jgi:hypothetical protein